jgi:hypothetical protein
LGRSSASANAITEVKSCSERSILPF